MMSKMKKTVRLGADGVLGSGIDQSGKRGKSGKEVARPNHEAMTEHRARREQCSEGSTGSLSAVFRRCF
ncbi:MAG: hypothetical protein EA001_02355 [Oscillatoriales cyanobacterium]|nr:MAG: hypothetical protein EA001_02355 [Oscillatoriales cyanobacterium]